MIERLNNLSTPHLADACLRVGAEVRCAPAALQAIDCSMHCAGRVLPAQHSGSVDIFLEAFETAKPGDVLVVDDGGRQDRACVGDLITREAKMAGLAGIVIWGCHRDTNELLDLKLPFFSLGRVPTGPLSVDSRSDGALEHVSVGVWELSRDDIVVGDCDGIIFLPQNRLEDIVIAAEMIRDREEQQAVAMTKGSSLRQQLDFQHYLDLRKQDPAYGFREHLRKIGGAVEE